MKNEEIKKFLEKQEFEVLLAQEHLIVARYLYSDDTILTIKETMFKTMVLEANSKPMYGELDITFTVTCQKVNDTLFTAKDMIIHCINAFGFEIK